MQVPSSVFVFPLGAWIITGGMHAGVMKQVGDAVHDNLVAHGSKAGLVAIGIATWGCVKGKELLVKDGVSNVCMRSQFFL